jgi:hypothetical protein
MRIRLAVPLLAALALIAACDQQGAYGDANSIVAVAPAELWGEIEDSVYSALEPTIWTVRNEKMFTVTYQDPTGQGWANLRRFHQMLLIGPANEPWIREALDEARGDDPAPPSIVQVRDVWARDQLVTIVLTPEQGGAEAVRSQLDSLSTLYDRQYRQWAMSRMFVSGADTALADTLAREAGFRVTIPTVYYWDRQDSVYLFRNDNPDPSELIRQVMVTWMSPLPQGLEAEGLLAWREDVAEAYYTDDQIVVLDNAEAGPIDVDGHEAYQIQAVWQSPPESFWPAAGPLILRAVRCPEQDRLYLLDAWLYAPGKEKYEYMIQLERILDSFECGAT